MKLLLALRQLNADQIAVVHNPMSTRYRRAGTRVDYLVRHGVSLGRREHDSLPPSDALEVALWAPPPSGSGRGYYACFRVEFDDGYPVFAVLFAFYDGTDASPGLSNLSDARAYARTQGFQDEDQD